VATNFLNQKTVYFGKNSIMTSEFTTIKTMFENAPVGIILTTISGEVISMNDQMYKMFGYSSIDEMKRYVKNVAEDVYANPEDRESLLSSVKNNQTDKLFFIQGKTKDKNIIDCEVFVNKYTDKDTNEEYLIGIVEDVTKQKKTEELLRQSNERYKSIITVSNTGAWEYKNDSDYLWCSPEYFTMLGYNPNDFIKEGRVNLKEVWINLLHPEDREKADNTFADYLKKGSAGMYENYFRMKHINGSWIWIWSRGQTLRKPDGTLTDLTVGTHIDITSQKEAEKKLIDYKNNLEIMVQQRTNELELVNKELGITNKELSSKSDIIKKQNEKLTTTIHNLKETQLKLVQAEKMASLGILTAGVAHEINNPLNYVMGAFVGLNQYFEEYESSDKEKTDFLLNSLKIGVERISNIVVGLNQFSRSKESVNEDCDIHTIIDNCIRVLHNKIENSVEVVKEFADEKIVIRGNVGKLHQVFVNIINNAIQAIKNKGSIHIRTMAAGNQLIVEISDDGIGISEKNIQKITDPFFTTKPPGEGTGLGLSISNIIIKDHKGAMEFKSEVGKGTKVILTLPLK
jgi:PAS domain S-box-containing protein